MTEKNDGGSAFPWPSTYSNATRTCPRCNGGICTDGMSLRDYFAAQALAAVVAVQEKPTSEQEAAEWAYRMADAMIKARV